MATRDIIVNLEITGKEGFVSATAEASKAEAALNKEVTKNTTAVAANEVANEKLSAKLRRTRDELAKLALAGKANTDEYRKLRNEAGQLSDAIGDAAAEIKQAGSDTRGLDKALRAATVLTGAFTAVQGAAALFGKDSENLQKSLLKVQAALSILNGLQAIQTELLAKDSILTTGLTRVKAAYTAAIGASTGALKTFRIALISTGIGAAVVALGLLIANWDKLKAAIAGNSKVLEDAKKALDENKTSIDAKAQALEREILRLRAKGVAEKDLLTISRAQLQENVKIAAADLKTLNTAIAIAKARALDNVEDRLNNADKELAKKRALADIDAQFAEQLEATRNQFFEQEDALVSNTIAFQNLEKSEKKSKDTKKENTDEIKAQIGSVADLTARIAELTKLQQASNDPKQIALYGAQIEVLQAQITILTDKAQQFFTATQKFAERPVSFDPLKVAIRQVKTEAELAEEAFLKLPESVRKAQEAVANIVLQPPKPTRTLADIRAEAQAERDLRIQAAAQTGQAVFDIVRQSQQAQQQALENRLAQGLITEEQYNEELKKLRRKEAAAAKLQAVFQASLNLAQAISVALAKTANPVFAGIVAALAAAQLAAIIATPIPKFFKGVKNFMGGLAWVGDGGKQEVVRTPDGSVGLTPDKPTLTYLPKGSDVFKDVPTFAAQAARRMPMPSLAGSALTRRDDEVKKLLKQGNAKYDEVLTLLRQGNLNTRQGVNHLAVITNQGKKKHRV